MKRRIISITITFVSLALIACGDYPIFTEMATNRMKVIIKGTYESNGPAAWDSSKFAVDDSVDDCTASDECTAATVVNPSEFMLDIAEMRLQGSGDADKFAFYRQTYSVPIGIEAEPFFDGTGVEYGCDDPYSGYSYTKLLVYIRKMIFNNATNWLYDYTSSTWGDPTTPDVIFREDEVPGFDFNQLQYITYWDSLRTNADDILHIFPLVVQFPPGGFIYDRNDPETVLEVRFVIKNFIKMYEYDYNSSGNYYVTHFWGLSDWLRDVRADDPVMGGNILAVARSYVPGKTATITGNYIGGEGYVIAIEKDIDKISNYDITVPPRPDLAGRCYQPKPPTILDSNDPEAVLDYYIEYELYRSSLNDFINNCLDPGFYEDDWKDYNDTIKELRIPPIAAYTVDGNYALTNVPVGKTYLVYWAPMPVNYYDLPTGYVQVGSDVVIPANGAGNSYP